jgi:oligopeptide/dipeptide ABC transporter ATP-binding protein
MRVNRTGEDPVLSVNNLVTRFKTEQGLVTAIEGVSFNVKKGEILGIVGESGCGKSVTSQSILRLYDEKRTARYEGEIMFGGRNLLTLPQKEMRKIRGKQISMVFQDALSSLDTVFTVGYQLCEPLVLHSGCDKKTAHARAVEHLSIVDIPDPGKRIDQYPHELSGGMRQRVMIAIALACEPSLLIADEPTTALDVTIQAQIMDLIVELGNKLDMGVILITHDLAVVAETCSRVIVMYLGQIVEEADVDDLFNNPSHPYTRGLIGSIPKLEGERAERLPLIPGIVPLLDQIPSGCRFAPRCTFAADRCFKEMPEISIVDESLSPLQGQTVRHRVRCFNPQKGAVL